MTSSVNDVYSWQNNKFLNLKVFKRCKCAYFRKILTQINEISCEIAFSDQTKKIFSLHQFSGQLRKVCVMIRWC